MKFHNMLYCLLLASFSELVYCLRGQEITHDRCFTWVGSCLNRKHYIILKRLARGEHSSVLQKFTIYDLQSFITLAPGLNVIKLFLSFRSKLKCL
jgi:hypothetical protein